MLLERPPGADVIGEQFECTVLARRNGLRVLDAFGYHAGRAVRRWPNLRASVAVFKIARG